VGVRMPAHGTVPAALTKVRWEHWLAATRLAVRHARELAGVGAPLHIVGYSNGGALALKYSLDALDDPALARADQIVLISPMIGITSVARFAGVLGWPAAFPAFAKAAWLDTVPEYNPFKYNSFPVNGARQSSQLVRAVRKQVAGAGASKLAGLPPVLTFQSALDSTVSTRALFDTFYRYLPKRGHEVVLFDRNHGALVGPLVRPALIEPLVDVLPASPRSYAVTVVTNALGSVEAQTVLAGASSLRILPLDETYPSEIYSLSHVALPFPPSDGLYGYAPPDADFGLRLGTIAERGERGTLIVSAETLMRASCNPFFGYLLGRIDATLAPRTPATSGG
jgi:alpha-beta hydrolase superfamily lysophospholipase